MLRQVFARQYREMSAEGFRWRSHEISRIEGLSDAVFGFAITLLIVSLEVPRTSTELLETMRGFGSFIITFVMLAGIWRAQFTFFRRYGLEDNVTVNLNLAILFTVLFFAYPLKFLVGVMLEDPGMRHLQVETPHGLQLAVLPAHRPWIFFIFGLGFAAVFALFALLYRHAYENRERLELNELEVFETVSTMRRQMNTVFVGVSYFALAGAMSLPGKSRGEKLVMIAALLAIIIVLCGLMIRAVRLGRERKAFLAEWRKRSADDVAPH